MSTGWWIFLGILLLLVIATWEWVHDAKNARSDHWNADGGRRRGDGGDGGGCSGGDSGGDSGCGGGHGGCGGGCGGGH